VIVGTEDLVVGLEGIGLEGLEGTAGSSGIEIPASVEAKGSSGGT